MHDNRFEVEARLRRVMRERVEPAIYVDAVPLSVESWVAPGEPVAFDVAVDAAYEPAATGTAWGRAWGTTWFRLRGMVPASWEWTDRYDTELLIDLGFTAERPGFQCEGLAYTADGAVLNGIAPRSPIIRWDPSRRGLEIDLLVEGASNPDVAGAYSFAPTPLGSLATAGDALLYTLGRVAIVRRDRIVWELLQDLRLIAGMIAALPADGARTGALIHHVDRALDLLDPDDVGATAEQSRSALQGVLSPSAHASSHRVVGVGHAHIDSAWLWPARETVRKCARTFANALALIDENPDFVFVASSAQQYAWVKDAQPELFERIKAAVASGQFVPVGGMWVESDTMMPSGESLVRQFLLGKQFFQREFGVDTEEVWLPDSFGYSAALPQIARRTGHRWLLTQKLSWNRTNQMPHHTFQWEGIDGSAVFTHFPPVDTYISELSPAELLHAERNFRESGPASVSLVPFGWGDGGGGPTREMLAAGDRARDVEGLPKVAYGSARDFFEQAEAEYESPPKWTGEMYLELHRGIFTSQLATKQGNRRAEALLREAEIWATTAHVNRGIDYPGADIETLWEKVLLLQFHDILPGTSISWVYADAARIYEEVLREAESIIARSVRALTGEGRQSLVADVSPHPLRGAAPFAITAKDAAAHAPVVIREGQDGGVEFDNGTVAIAFSADGRVVSLVSRDDGRNAIIPGGGVRLVLHRDTPNEWDAWDIDSHYRHTSVELAPTAGSFEWAVAADGSAVATVDYTFGASSARQQVTLHPGSEQLDLAVEVDWHERQKLLKLYVDLDVHADRYATETQFGHIFRPTAVNTSWESAKFEACGHRWLHVAEGGYGVGVINDSTYGHNVVSRARAGGGRATIVGLSLLRAPLFPDPEADQGVHRMNFALMPGASIRDAVDAGYRMSHPSREVLGGQPATPLVTVDGGAIVEALKMAQDGSGDVIVRVYEPEGRRVRAALAVSFDVDSVVETDLVERAIDEVQTAALTHPVAFELAPFEIRTFRFVRAGSVTAR